MDRKKVLSLNIDGKYQDIEKMPGELMLSMADELALNVPIQMILELTPKVCIGSTVNDPEFPDAPGQFVYVAKFESVKARVKPLVAVYTDEEQKMLDQIINDEEDVEKEDQEKVRQEQYIEDNACNRFMGIEITDED